MIKIQPGEILINNVNRGVDSTNSNFQILYNTDLKQEIRCRRNFLDLKKRRNDDYEFKTNLPGIFGLNRENKELLYPVVLGPDGKEAYLLNPPFPDHIFSGGAIVDMIFEEETFFNGKRICLGHSKIFHNDFFDKKSESYPFKYKAMIHREEQEFKRKGFCQALVFKLSRKATKCGNLQNFKHIDAYFLDTYDRDLFDKNTRKLEYIAEHESSMWFDQGGSILETFEDITFKEPYRDKSNLEAARNSRKVVNY